MLGTYIGLVLCCDALFAAKNNQNHNRHNFANKLNFSELEISLTSLKISLTFLEISLTFLEISLTFLEISLTFLEISLTFLEISLTFLEISLTFLEISLTFLEISLTFLEISLTFLKISLTSLKISLTSLKISSIYLEISSIYLEISSNLWLFQSINLFVGIYNEIWVPNPRLRWCHLFVRHFCAEAKLLVWICLSRATNDPILLFPYRFALYVLWCDMICVSWLVMCKMCLFDILVTSWSQHWVFCNLWQRINWGNTFNEFTITTLCNTLKDYIFS